MLKARMSAVAVGVLVFSLVHSSLLRADKDIGRGNFLRRLIGRSLCVSLLAVPLASAGLAYYQPWTLLTGRTNYKSVEKIKEDHRWRTSRLLGSDGMGSFDILDAQSDAPSIVYNLGKRGIEYKRKLFQFLNPAFPMDTPIDPLIVFQIKSIVFVVNPDHPDMVDLYLRITEVGDVKIPIPISLDEIENGTKPKKILLRGVDPEAPNVTGEIGIEFQFLPDKKVFSISRIHVMVVFGSLNLKLFRTPQLPLSNEIKGVVAYRSTEKISLNEIPIPQEGVTVE